VQSPLPIVPSDEWSYQPNTVVPILDGTNLTGTARIIALPDLSLVSITNSASPQKTQTEQLAAIDAEASRRAAIRNELNLTAGQIAAIQAYFDADVDTLFSSLSANQRQFLKVQRAAVRYLLKQELKEVAP